MQCGHVCVCARACARPYGAFDVHAIKRGDGEEQSKQEGQMTKFSHFVVKKDRSETDCGVRKEQIERKIRQSVAGWMMEREMREKKKKK